jgi:uncharacterized damage-inducible protein DinB
MSDLSEHLPSLLPSNDEHELLDGFLDWFRETAVQKVSGLSLEEATRVSTPTGLTLLGVIKHLTWVEHMWIDTYLLGGPRPEVDNPTSFVVGPGDTLDSVLSAYDAAVGHAREECGARSLDDTAAGAHALFGNVSVRWILIHMIEETARHCGHMDILREQTDGATG